MRPFSFAATARKALTCTRIWVCSTGEPGNIGEAKKELRTALQLAPNDTDAQNALAMLERAHEEQVK